jgi:hypothetical protein
LPKYQVPGKSQNTAQGGYGKKTLAQINEMLDLPISQSVAILQTAGITADAESTIRELAVAHNQLPIDIIELIQPGFTFSAGGH